MKIIQDEVVSIIIWPSLFSKCTTQSSSNAQLSLVALVSKVSTIPTINCLIEQKGMHLNYDFYVVVGKQCRVENA